MKTMKKAMSLILGLVLLLSLFAGCGEKKEETPATSQGKTDTPANTEAPKTDLEGLGTTGAQIKEAAKYEDEFIIGGQIQISAIDPQTYADTYYVTKLVYDPLLTYSNGEYKPALATSWKKTGDYTYEFTLREDVTFQDGGKFTADDVVFTLGERVKTVVGSTTAAKLACVEKVEALGDYKVKFTLNSLNQDFLLFMTQPYSVMLSRKACTADPDKGFFIGTGPWKITDFVPGIKVDMVRYDGFWGELPKPSKMFYVAYPEDNGRVVAIQSGDVDATIALPSTENENIRNDKTIHGVSILDSGLAYCCFNTQDPVIGDLNLRKAIAYAIDYDEIIDVVCNGDAERSGTFWGSGSYAEYKELKGYDYNLEKAKEYIAQSNYDGSTISIMCAIPSNVTTATILVDRLADIGVKAVVDERDFVGVITNTGYGSASYQMLCFNAMFGESGDDCCRRMFYTGESGNKVQLNDPDLDKKIDEALVETDEAKRIQMYHEIQEYNIDNVLYLPLGHSYYYCAEGLNVSGIDWSANSTQHDFRYGCVAIPD